MYADFIEDDILGKIFIRKNKLSKRLIIRHRQLGYVLTLPVGVPIDEARRFIAENRHRIGKLGRRQWSFAPITEDSPLMLSTVTVKVCSRQTDRCVGRLTDKVLMIDYPYQERVTDGHIQYAFWQIIEDFLVASAKKELPTCTERLAGVWGFRYQSVRVQRSKTRWGSCSQSKNINLSAYLLLLPVHLQEYVILHELCHTREMNHSDRFWAEMERVTNHRSKQLRQEIKQYNIPQW